MSNENNASFALGIIFGAFVGAVAGVLLAPASGEETRQKVKDAADKVIDRMPEDLSNAKKSTLDVLERIKLSIEGQIEQINDVIIQYKMAEAKKKEDACDGYEI